MHKSHKKALYTLIIMQHHKHLKCANKHKLDVVQITPNKLDMVQTIPDTLDLLQITP